MSNLDAAAAHKGQMLAPGFRTDTLDETRQLREPALFNRDGAGHAESDGMQGDGHLAGQRLQRVALLTRSIVVVVRDHFHYVDTGEIGENAGGQFLAPPSPKRCAEATGIV